jgi:hypothetical protein
MRQILWLASSKILTPPPPSPSPPGECVPPAFGAGEDTLARGRGGWGVNILEDDRHCSVLYVCKYFVPVMKYLPLLCRNLNDKRLVLLTVLHGYHEKNSNDTITNLYFLNLQEEVLYGFNSTKI